MNLRSVLNLFAVLVLTGTLAACEDSETRAERYYQSGLALLEAGDVERALIEFRNVFDLNGNHREARSTYARVVREQGNLREAVGQYRRLVEQYPDDLDGQIALAEMHYSLQQGQDQKNQFERHSNAAISLAPEDPRVQALKAAADFRRALFNRDIPARNAALEQAIALARLYPDNKLLMQVEINGHVENANFAKALEALDRAIATDPENYQFALFRLHVLSQLQDDDRLEAHLRQMVTTFPEQDQPKKLLVSFYETENRIGDAEAFLREIADPSAEDPFYEYLLRFILTRQGPDAVLAELDRVIPTLEDPSRYQATRAGIIFDQGRHDEAIALMEEIIAGTEASVLQREVKVSLAGMLRQTGNDVGGRKLVEQVLAEDPGQVAALRMNAQWQIELGDTDAAIATLRRALDQAPEDVLSMNLMAQAYLNSGNRNLARDFLSLAADTSKHAVPETLRYADFLIEEKRYLPAEQTLQSSLRAHRNNPDLLVKLGRVYLQMEDYSRLKQVIAQLRALDGDRTERAAAGLQTAMIERVSGTDAALAYLEGISKDWSNSLTAQAAVARARVSAGDIEGALATARAALAENPDDPDRRYLMAAIQAAAKQFAEAEAGMRALLAEDPAQPGLWVQLARLVTAQERGDEVAGLIEEGLAANPGSTVLLWSKASLFEKSGNIDGAIEIYEQLYEANPNAIVVSNNLASLLATHRDDADSLARAATVAQRLKTRPEVAFRDTWGWISFRQGNLEEALENLEVAARGLPDDAQVQYHLGRVYLALERTDEARAQFEKAVELAGPQDTRAAIEDARKQLEALQ